MQHPDVDLRYALFFCRAWTLLLAVTVTGIFSRDPGHELGEMKEDPLRLVTRRRIACSKPKYLIDDRNEVDLCNQIRWDASHVVKALTQTRVEERRLTANGSRYTLHSPSLIFHLFVKPSILLLPQHKIS